MSPPFPSTARVSRSGDLTGVVLTVAGTLDRGAGEALVTATTLAVADGASRLDIDLSGVDDFDDEGAEALLTCRNLTVDVAAGLHYRTCGPGAGQDALLKAYADPHGNDGSAASSEAWEPAS